MSTAEKAGGRTTPTIYQPIPEHPALDALDPGLLAAVVRGEARLTPRQGLDLLVRAPMHTLGRYADARCRHVHGDAIRTYVIDRNINYTNVCTAKCTFCAFRRDATDHDAYTLEKEELFAKVEEVRAIGGTQILMQGGMNPELPLDWYLDLLRELKIRFPGLHIHAFSPPEMIEFVNFFDPPGANLEEKIRWVMVRLQQAGLDSLPGGGGEIFAPAVRNKIGLGKCTAEAWLTTMYVALVGHVHQRDDDVRAHRGPRRPRPPHAARSRVAGPRSAQLRNRRDPRVGRG